MPIVEQSTTLLYAFVTYSLYKFHWEISMSKNSTDELTPRIASFSNRTERLCFDWQASCNNCSIKHRNRRLVRSFFCGLQELHYVFQDCFEISGINLWGNRFFLFHNNTRRSILNSWGIKSFLLKSRLGACSFTSRDLFLLTNKLCDSTIV